ncbi:PREDICTED: receptor-like protein kinase At5g59670 [Camelina sativa]|uniref:non-specific serine/threonine protein kinase n=1 Tax=Camelina sativa TaxID=90675 RepID=A0ABM1QME5_CAMSA|nr:PREDICTED: receptor-like protein kinase At5g59670 [Camelina sativa]XP_019087933.1 PREDICTED: receptor-like protein kinase At5g59670 [Camelina sativa]
MERSLWLFLFVLIANLAISHLARVQSQEGFISLDCGLPVNEESPYNESEATGLLYSSDATFIQSGKTESIEADLGREYPKPLRTLRYFPEGKRNCYNLNVEKGRNHLISARFLYGNYDGHGKGPKFDLYLGPNLWATVDLRGNENGTWEEILHIPTSNKLQICLVKTGESVPMISALELRPMGIDSYVIESGSLNLFFREYFTESDTYIRFPEDVYDRRWFSYFRKQEWTQISTSSFVGNFNDYDPPKDALATAAIPTDASEPWTYEWDHSDNPSASYYLYAHFAEIQDLQANDTREFNILFNGQQYDGPLIPKKLEITTIVNSSPRTCDGGECSFQLTRTDRSTLPPLLNALEVYTVIQFPHSETEESDVITINSIKDAYELNTINWQGDPCVPRDLIWDGLNCSYTNISTPPRITSLDLSSTGLTGTIAAALQNLTQLEKLDLSNNKLTGGVPEFLGNMKSLTVINLSGNNLNGSIPQALQGKGLELSVEGNPMLCVSASCRKSPKKKFPLAIVVASVVGAAIVITVLVLFLVIRKKKSTVVEGLHLLPGASAVNATFANKSSRRFTYSEVVKMTNNFHRVLGKGGFGMVYHGSVNGYEQVAVKVLSQSSTQGYKEFKAEVDLLMRVHHTNLVSLVGYCYEGDHLALIYEFLPNGDLKQHLSGKGGGSIINWSTRLRIALEAALGLEYLHVGCKPPMVHRDIKTANILLDENFKAKIADFGLSRSFQGGGDSEESTVIAGSRGYLDPEYNHSGRLAEKSDVYSFGIVLLEMITNQPVINQTSEYPHITQRVGFQIKRGDILEVMDPNLGKDYDINSAWRALELAMSCANPSSSKRPSMSQVINELKECITCENSGISTNRGLESQEVNVGLDTTVVPMAR